MKTKEVPEAAVKRSVAWISAVEKALAEAVEPAVAGNIMKAAGYACAQQILADCEEILGRKPETIDELLEATNKRRLQRHKLADLWEKEGNRAHLVIRECACTLVKAGLAEPGPTHCLCSRGMWERLFAEVHKGRVTVEMVRTVGFGDDGCEFYVTFE